MSAPKLTAFLSAVEPDGTVTVRVSASGEVRPVPRAPTSLREAARQLGAATGLVLYIAGRDARTLDEFHDMTALSVYATSWMQAICLSLGIDE